MSDDLVERVARAICETENGPCKCMPDECGCTYWKARARAAIAVVLEEAAQAAETYHNPTCNCEVCYGHEQAAAAIRALVKQSTTEEERA